MVIIVRGIRLPAAQTMEGGRGTRNGQKSEKYLSTKEEKNSLHAGSGVLQGQLFRLPLLQDFPLPLHKNPIRSLV
jgi:hypothetical protein